MQVFDFNWNVSITEFLVSLFVDKPLKRKKRDCYWVCEFGTKFSSKDYLNNLTKRKKTEKKKTVRENSFFRKRSLVVDSTSDISVDFCNLVKG